MAYNSHKVIRIAPSRIRFTHESIGSTFTSGSNVNEAVEKIENGEMDVSDFPKIRVCVRDAKYYSLDNRRLYVFRVLERRGILRKIEVRLAEYDIDELTTTNEGRSVFMRGGRTFKHTIEAKHRKATDFDDSEDSSDEKRFLKPLSNKKHPSALISSRTGYGSCVKREEAAPVNYRQPTVQVVNVVQVKRHVYQQPPSVPEATQSSTCCCCVIL